MSFLLRYTETVTTLDIDGNMTSVICIHMINFIGPVTYVHVYIICMCLCVCVCVCVCVFVCVLYLVLPTYILVKHT